MIREYHNYYLLTDDEKYNIKDSGEFFDKLLYNDLTFLFLSEAKFILDIENYKCDYKVFKENFEKIKNSHKKNETFKDFKVKRRLCLFSATRGIH